MSDEPIIIVGGGPVGMLLAAELGTRGVPTTVLEARRVTHDEPRAGTLHARTVQSMVRHGYLPEPEPAVARSSGTLGVPFHFAGRPILTLEAPRAEGDPMAVLPQADVERFFERRARDAGVTVLRGRRVVDVTAHPDRVVVSVDCDTGREELSAGFVVGCDGARSVVRECLGISATTHPPTFAGILGLVRLRDPASVPGGWTHGPTGSVLANVTPGGLSRVLTHEFASPLPDRNAPVEVADLSAAAARILGHPVPMDSPTYLGRFSDFTRLVDTYRVGRMLLAGDAAHVHAPLGGQGLNTGLQDAFNLGWKLAMVASGAAPDRLLDTYHAERHSVAAAVIANTRVQAALMRPGAEFDVLRDFVADLLSLPGAASRVSDLITGQGVRYGPGPGLTGAFLPNTAIGDRTVAGLLRAGRPLLLLGGRSAEDNARATRGWHDRLDPVVVAELPSAEPIVLCRPDGYVAWAGQDPEELREQLETWFGPPRYQRR